MELTLWQTVLVSASGGVVGGVVVQLLSYLMERQRWRRDDRVRREDWARDDVVERRNALRDVHLRLFEALDRAKQGLNVLTEQRTVVLLNACDRDDAVVLRSDRTKRAVALGVFGVQGDTSRWDEIGIVAAELREALSDLAHEIRANAPSTTVNAFAELLRVTEDFPTLLAARDFYNPNEALVRLRDAIAVVETAARRDLGHQDAESDGR